MKWFLLSLLSVIPLFLCGQQNSFLLNIPDKFIVDSYSLKHDGFYHTSFKPVVKSTLNGYAKIDSMINKSGSDSAFISRLKHPWLFKKLLVESFVDVKKGNFSLRIDPLLNFEYGNDTATRMTVNSRGVIIYGDLNEKFSFTTGVMESQVFPEKYLTDYIKARSVFPGQGRVKGFKKTGYDFSNSFGNISYSSSSYFNFQLGHGKQFVGEGYRSLLLSDVPYYYPYFRITTTYKRFQYVNLWTAFQEVKPYDTRALVYQRKYGSFSYLSFFASKKIQFGLFEAIMFQSTDSNSNNQLPLSFANPLIGARTLQYGLRSKHNALIGLTSKINLLKQINMYGQFVIDDTKRKGETDFFNNRCAFQVGVKFIEPFNCPNLFFLAEFNHVGDKTYSPTVEHQSYSAFNEPLAHPLGTNLDELVVMIRYSYKDFFIQLKNTKAKTIADGYNIGQNILEVIDDNLNSSSTSQYYDITINNLNLEMGIIINQKSKLQLVGGIHIRESKDYFGDYVYFALRTPLSNIYTDF